jgi:hypothetical protein
MGSTKLTIARIDGNVLSGTDYWSSGINDIKSINASVFGYSPCPTQTSFGLSWTVTDGTIHISKQLAASGTGHTLWICSGGPA